MRFFKLIIGDGHGSCGISACLLKKETGDMLRQGTVGSRGITIKIEVEEMDWLDLRGHSVLTELHLVLF
jgi:hypothetical protein